MMHLKHITTAEANKSVLDDAFKTYNNIRSKSKCIR